MNKLAKIKQYLFEDFKFTSLGTTLDYNAYWEARSKADPTDEVMRNYKFNLIAQLIEPHSSVLEIGCGDGGLLAFLQERKSIIGYGVELSENACEFASKRGLKIWQIDVTKDDLSWMNTVDYVVISEVLEHIAIPEEVLLNLKEKFSKSLIVTVPNTGAINERLRLLFGRFPKQWVFHPGEHLRFWTVTDFMVMVTQLGFNVQNHQGLYDPYYNSPIKLWKRYPKLFSRYVLYVLTRK